MNRNSYLKISLAIVGLALIIGLIIVYHPEVKTKEVSANQNNEKNSVLQVFDLQKSNKKLGADLEGITISDEDNLTKKVNLELSQQILQLNQDNDLSSGYLEVPNEEIFSEEMMVKYKDDFLKNLSLATISDLTFAEENKPYTSIKYYYDYLSILYNRKITDDIIDQAMTSFTDNSDPAFLKDIIIKLNDAINDFKKMPIPSSFTDLHLQLINLTIEKKAILTALYNYQNDPISAMAASQLLEDLYNNYISWTTDLANKMKNDGVQFSN